MSVEDGFFDELLKIAKITGPGSRGGKIVGHRKSGRPIYASEKKDDDLVPMKRPVFMSRVVQGSLGTGLVAAQVPQVRRYAAGRQNLYHGTGSSAAAAIMAPGSGIDPAFAGSTKAGKDLMINSHLMADSMARLADKHKVPLSIDDTIDVSNAFLRRLRSGEKASEAASIVMDDLLTKLQSSGKLDVEKAKAMRAGLQKDLTSLGMRSYLLTDPTKGMRYASGKSEAAMAMDTLLENAARNSRRSNSENTARAAGRAMLETLTGGLPTVIEDARNKAKYKPHSVETMTMDEAHKELKRIAGKDAGLAGNKHRIVLGVSAPTGDMGYLEDFPVVRRVIDANPSFKHTMKDAFRLENYDPGNDLSVASKIPRENIKHVDIKSPETGKIRRILISDAKDAARSGLWKRVKRTSLPAALTAVGGYQLYRALHPKTTMVHKDHPRADLSKKSSVAGDLSKIYKYYIPAAVAGGAIGYGGHRVLEHALPRSSGKDPNAIAEGVKSSVRVLAPALLSAAAMGVAGRYVGKKTAPEGFKDLGKIMGTVYGTALGAAYGSKGAEGREAGRDPETGIITSHLSLKHRDWLRKHPGVRSMTSVAGSIAAPLAALYAARKYYPSAYAKTHKELRGLFRK